MGRGKWGRKTARTGYQKCNKIESPFGKGNFVNVLSFFLQVVHV